MNSLRGSKTTLLVLKRYDKYMHPCPFYMGVLPQLEAASKYFVRLSQHNDPSQVESGLLDQESSTSNTIYSNLQ